MAQKQKKTRKELLKEPDEFLTLSAKMLNFIMTHKKQVGYGAGFIVALILIISGFRFFSNRAENKASALLQESVVKYSTLINAKTPPDKAYQDVSEDFKLILEKYGSKQAGKKTRLMYANICYAGGDYEQARELYKKALGDFEETPLIRLEILTSLGYVHGQLNDYAAAAQYFEKVAASSEQIMRDGALFQLGLLYEKLGDPQKSKTAFETIVSDHQNSIYLDLAKEKITG